MAIRVIVAETGASNAATHGAAVKGYISTGYGSNIADQIQVIDTGFTGAYDIALASDDVVAIVRSYSDLNYNLFMANQLYRIKNVLSFFPLGSNSFIQLATPTDIPSGIVTCGAGDVGVEDQNNTAYGYGLEFWDNDGTISEGADTSSYSTGIICGKMLKILDQTSETWDTVRARARDFADRDEANRTSSPWDLYNGYGIINVTNAIAGATPEPLPIPQPDDNSPESILNNLHYYSVQELMNKIVGKTDHNFSTQECANYYYGNADLRKYTFQNVVNLILGHTDLIQWSVQECLNWLLQETNLQKYSVQEALSIIWNKVMSKGVLLYSENSGIKYNDTYYVVAGVQNV